MKLLENTTFNTLAGILSHETRDCRLETRLESYSCKMLREDKNLWKSHGGHSPNELQALSPPQAGDHHWPHLSPAAVSRSYSSDTDTDNHPVLLDSVSRKTLFFLTSTLTRSFPDYDFMDAKGENFSREASAEWVMKSVDKKYSTFIEGYNSQLRHGLWSALDQEIQLKEATAYSYSPDFANSDPFSSDGALWSFNYLFYNKRLKRVVLLASRAFSKLAPVEPEEYQTQWSLEGYSTDE